VRSAELMSWGSNVRIVAGEPIRRETATAGAAYDFRRRGLTNGGPVRMEATDASNA
jgi:hypothetical protein